MKTSKTKLTTEQKLQRRARLAHVRRVAEENEERFDRLFDTRPAFDGVQVRGNN